MLKDKLPTIELINGASVMEYLHQIQEIYYELASIGQGTHDVEIVEWINNLLLSYESIFQVFSAQAKLPTFNEISS